MIKVLIVDDSAFMRKLLSDLFAGERDFTVIDTARNGKDAVEKVIKLRPDVVTLDVEMPVMDGLKALEAIMRESPTPVVMVSSLTRAGAEATLRALELGAVDFIAKTAGPIASIDAIKQELVAKCRAAARSNFNQLPLKRLQPMAVTAPKPLSIPQSPAGGSEKVVAIGASTGGPRALQEIITKLPANFPCGVVIVQHMPPGFTRSLAERLNSLSSIRVKEAEHNDFIQPGTAFIAPGDYHMTLEREGGRTLVKLNQTPPLSGHRPSVDPLFETVARIYGAQAVGVLLTGMGHDGAKGMQAIKNSNGYTIAEDQSTAVVFGMPKSAIELGVVDKILPLNAIAAEVIKAVTQ